MESKGNMNEMVNENDLHNYESSYSEDNFKSKLQRFAKKAGLNTTYYALLLFYVLKSGNWKDKTIIYGALGYFIAPFDIIPDIMLGVGFLDDAAALCIALKAVSTAITPDVEQAAKEQLHRWFDFKDEELKTPNND